MPTRLPWLLLALSLALNLFAVAGVVYSKTLVDSDPPSPAERLDNVVERLALDTAQRDQLVALRQQAVARRDQMRDGHGRLREVFIATLAAPGFDRAAFVEQMGGRSAARLEFFAGTLGDLHGFLAGLSPEQKATFLELAEERGFLRQLLGGKRRR